MFIAKELEKQKVIKRKGEIPTIKLPAKMCSSYDVLINIKKKELSFIDGDSIFIIDKKIGIAEETEFTVFFADEYVVVELQWGRIYLKDDKYKTYYVTETGSVGKKHIEEEKIKWLTQEDLIMYMSIMVKNKYNLFDDMAAKRYIDNLSITVVTANEKIKNSDTENNAEIEQYMFRIKVKDYYDDLGLDKFEYKVYEPKQRAVNMGLTTEVDSVDNSWEDEKRRLKAEKQKELKAEMEYKRIKDGDDFSDSYNDEILEDEDSMDEEELYGLNGFSITEEEE